MCLKLHRNYKTLFTTCSKVFRELNFVWKFSCTQQKCDFFSVHVLSVHFLNKCFFFYSFKHNLRFFFQFCGNVASLRISSGNITPCIYTVRRGTYITNKNLLKRFLFVPKDIFRDNLQDGISSDSLIYQEYLEMDNSLLKSSGISVSNYS